MRPHPIAGSPGSALPDRLIAVVAFAQYALRLGQAQKPGSQRTRFEAARALMAETVRQEFGQITACVIRSSIVSLRTTLIGSAAACGASRSS